jgi:hypothetical protein
MSHAGHCNGWRPQTAPAQGFSSAFDGQIAALGRPRRGAQEFRGQLDPT